MREVDRHPFRYRQTCQPDANIQFGFLLSSDPEQHEVRQQSESQDECADCFITEQQREDTDRLVGLIGWEESGTEQVAKTTFRLFWV